MEFKQIGKTMLPAAQKLSDKSICIRLHTINPADDAIANDGLRLKQNLWQAMPKQ